MNSGPPHCRGRRGAGARYARLRLPQPPPPTQRKHGLWKVPRLMETADQTGAAPRRVAPLPPPTAAPGPLFPQSLANRLPAPRRARPPPTALAGSHTYHSPGDDGSYTLIWRTKPAEGGSLSSRCPGSVSERCHHQELSLAMFCRNGKKVRCNFLCSAHGLCTLPILVLLLTSCGNWDSWAMKSPRTMLAGFRSTTA
jgi:hypothetical protein